MIFCHNCGNQIPDDSIFCPECGQKQLLIELDALNNKICPVCGAVMPHDAYYCFECGALLNNVATTDEEKAIRNLYEPRNRKNKWIALILCVFFGWLGAHKFYEGKFVQGFVYMITIGIFGFGWLIDAVSYIFKPTIYTV